MLEGLLAGLGTGGLDWQTAVSAPLAQISAWQFALAHLIFRLVWVFGMAEIPISKEKNDEQK